MYLTSLEIKNLRCFRETKIELQHPDRLNSLKFKNINILLGNNGSGKSTILRALALATLYPVLQKNSGLVLDRLVRDTGKRKQHLEDAILNAYISLHSQDLERANLARLPIINLRSIIRRSGDIENLLEFGRESSSSEFTQQSSNRTPISTKESIEYETFLNAQNEVSGNLNLHPLIELNKVLRRQGRLKEAEEALYELRNIEPENVEVYIELSKIYWMQRKWKEAEEVLLNVLYIEAENLQARTELSKIYRTQRKWKEAETLLLEAIKIDSKELKTRLELSKIYQHQKKWKEAEDVLLESLKIDYKNPPTLVELSKIYQHQKKWKEAEDVLLESLKIDYENLQARTELSKIYRQQKKWKEAEDVLLKALEVDPMQLYPRTELSKIYQRQRKWEEAENILLESLKIDKNNLQARTELGKIYQEQGKLEKAEEILLELLNIDSMNLQARNEIARIYQKQQKLEKAEKLLLESLEIEPEQIYPRILLSELYLIQGKMEESTSILNKDSLDAVIKEMFEDNSPAFLVVGYGVTRRVEETTKYNFREQSRIRRLRYSRVASLFENNYGLIPLSSWLPEMELTNKGRFTQVVHLIDRITPEDMKFKGEFINDEYYCNFRDIKTPVATMSDGYRHFVGWIADLLYHICLSTPTGKKLVDNKGLVLVDEVDLLLHPEWQRTVIEALSKNLPNLQFVFTTHSPIIASSVEKENVFVMETDSDGSAIVKQFNESIYGLTAEQVLLSSYFGLETTRPESFVKEEIQPVSDKAIYGKHEDALEFIRKLNNPVELDKTKFSDFLK